MKPRDYYEAAWQRFEEAQHLAKTGRFGLALTLSGVAAECMLRAFIPPERPFDARHDLVLLLRDSTIDAGAGEKARRELGAALQVLRSIWRTSYRYRTDARQNTLVKRLPAYRRLRGDGRPLVQSAADAIAAAAVVIRKGESAWQREHE